MALDTAASSPMPPAVAEGAIHAYYLFDVADTIDLSRLANVAGEGVARAPLTLRREASPGTVQFPVTPVLAALHSRDVGGRRARLRAKFFDYGVVSLRLTFQFAGAWNAFASLARDSDGRVWVVLLSECPGFNNSVMPRQNCPTRHVPGPLDATVLLENKPLRPLC